MKFYTKLVISAAILASAGGVRAQDVSDLGKVKFSAIREMAMKVQNNVVFADVVVEISNESDKTIVIRDANYSIRFQRPANDLPINEVTLDSASPVAESELPPGLPGKPTRTNVLVTVRLGDASWETAENVVGPLFNIIGKRPKSIKITLNGQASVGVKVGQATDFGTARRDLRFEFTPTTNKDEALLR